MEGGAVDLLRKHGGKTGEELLRGEPSTYKSRKAAGN
jgi:hypothetical protein